VKSTPVLAVIEIALVHYNAIDIEPRPRVLALDAGDLV
jgi:hypothetical protein